jgi:hypothetical protein
MKKYRRRNRRKQESSLYLASAVCDEGFSCEKIVFRLFCFRETLLAANAIYAELYQNDEKTLPVSFSVFSLKIFLKGFPFLKFSPLLILYYYIVCKGVKTISF